MRMKQGGSIPGCLHVRKPRKSVCYGRFGAGREDFNSTMHYMCTYTRSRQAGGQESSSYTRVDNVVDLLSRMHGCLCFLPL
jgi:hypothetical protein